MESERRVTRSLKRQRECEDDTAQRSPDYGSNDTNGITSIVGNESLRVVDAAGEPFIAASAGNTVEDAQTAVGPPLRRSARQTKGSVRNTEPEPMLEDKTILPKSAPIVPNSSPQNTKASPVAKKQKISKRNTSLNPETHIERSNSLLGTSLCQESRSIPNEIKRKVTARQNGRPKINEEVANPNLSKPPAIGKPQVWSDTRQELCESLPSFRAYQSGCYSSKGFARGLLVDGHASERDYMDASIIISHAGGNSADIGGERLLVKDQTWDKGVIASLRSNRDHMVPIMVIIGERCPTAPARLEHKYSVMDWFKVTHCWPEKDSNSGNIRCKFRLEKLDTSVRGWWAASRTPCVSDDLSVEYVSCEACKQGSPYIYEGEPMCLNKDCNRFWTVINGKTRSSPKRFEYRKSFLNGKTNWPKAALIPPGPLAPSLPINNEGIDNNGRDIKRRFWKGMCCPNCNKLNCRELWKGWNCTNCDWTFAPKRSHFIPSDLSDPHRPEFSGPPIPENIVDPNVKSESVVLPDGRRAITYDVYQCGKVVHILANRIWNAMPGGSDWLLDKYQDVDMPFKRHELKSHKLTGRLLTQQFSFNSGAPYKYIVEVDSLSFEKSPAVVQEALKILQTDVTNMFPDAQPMNEILNVAYFEEQKMDFHDDGEEDLGPCVSSISLGSPAMMYFRVKAKYCTGNIAPADRALLVPSMPSPSGSAANGLKRPVKRNILELRLHHGDVIIMNGRSIQRILEHAVTPEGYRIAATARNISSRNVVPNAREARKTSAKKSIVTPEAEPGNGKKTDTAIDRPPLQRNGVSNLGNGAQTTVLDLAPNRMERSDSQVAATPSSSNGRLLQFENGTKRLSLAPFPHAFGDGESHATTANINTHRAACSQGYSATNPIQDVSILHNPLGDVQSVVNNGLYAAPVPDMPAISGLRSDIDGLQWDLPVINNGQYIFPPAYNVAVRNTVAAVSPPDSDPGLEESNPADAIIPRNR